MCEDRSKGRRAGGGPHWGALYAYIAVTLGPMAGAALVLPPALRAPIVGGLALAPVAAMVLWVRANRVAIARQEGCACSWEKTTVRVIPSRVPAVSRRPEIVPTGVGEYHAQRERDLAAAGVKEESR